MNIPDVNVLLALSWKNHIHHRTAREWFSSAQHEPFATCPITECGFVRLSMNPSVVGEPVSFKTALQVLENYYSLPNHRFLPLEQDFQEMTKRFSVSGHRQTADAYLLGTAICVQGRLITFDRRIKEIISGIPDADIHLQLLQ